MKTPAASATSSKPNANCSQNKQRSATASPSSRKSPTKRSPSPTPHPGTTSKTPPEPSAPTSPNSRPDYGHANTEGHAGGAGRPRQPTKRAHAMTGALCGAQRRNGDPCRRPAGWGTQHAGYGACKLHGGSTPNGHVHAAKLEA